ncbi:MAG: sigma-54-dependent Fis family transcriptional regulator [Nitrospira sp.]|nr:sigma-54-dependent Fis family transcriptional regulator [Nitrospira sp.]
MRATIYVTDDDQNVCSALSRRLVKKGHLVRSFHSGPALIEALEHELPDLLFLDLKMPEMDGLETLRQIRQKIPKTLVVMLTAYGSVEDAVEAMRLGAYDFLIKSIDFSTVEPALHRAITFLELRRRIEFSASEKQRQYSWEHVIAKSPTMTKVIEQLKFFDAQDAPLVFLQGEVGTGKEFLARILHYNSHKQLGPFVTVSCNEQRGSLLEPQIFGYERGAFSGASQSMPGAFEHSDGGTLFVDEIEHLPIPIQGSLAEAIRTREFCRMGGFDRLPANNRLVVTSSIPLDKPGNQEIFHPELHSLLEKQQLFIPPLRERKEDIIPLVIKTIHAYGEEIGRPKLDIDSSVPPLLDTYQFPGNIRELEAMIRRAVLCSQGPILTSLDFYSQHPGSGEGLPPNTGRVLFEIGQHSLQDIQVMAINEVLRFTKQDKEQAAGYLHISTQTLDEHIQLQKNFSLETEGS